MNEDGSSQESDELEIFASLTRAAAAAVNPELRREQKPDYAGARLVLGADRQDGELSAFAVDQVLFPSVKLIPDGKGGFKVSIGGTENE